MAPPSPPLALSAAYLALLHAGHAPPTQARAGAGDTPAPAERPAAPASPSLTGRGRLVDILA